MSMMNNYCISLYKMHTEDVPADLKLGYPPLTQPWLERAQPNDTGTVSFTLLSASYYWSDLKKPDQDSHAIDIGGP